MIGQLGLAALVCALAPGWMGAEVIDSAAGGFTVRHTVTMKASPMDVYKQVMRVGEWWSPRHTFSGDAHKLRIEEKAGGCFCEELPNGGSVKHLEVYYLAPGKTLVMRGALGPLQSIAATGSMVWTFTAADGGTKVELTYTATGYLPAGMNTWAAPSDGMLKEQITRLKNQIETGSPGK